jgi:hypothetical protein
MDCTGLSPSQKDETLKITWDMMIGAFSAATESREPGSVTDPTLIPVIVGGEMMADAVVAGWKSKIDDIDVQLYDTLEVALEAIRAQIARGDV